MSDTLSVKEYPAAPILIYLPLKKGFLRIKGKARLVLTKYIKVKEIPGICV